MIFQTSKKLFSILDKNEKITLCIIFLFTFFAMLLEMGGLAIIIPFITVLLDYQENNFFQNYFNLSFIDGYRPVEIMNYGIIILLLFFLFKSIFISIFIWYQNNFAFKLNVRLSSKLYRIYINSSFEDFIQRNSADYTRNIEHEAPNLPNSLMGLINLVTDILIFLGIFLVIIIYEPFFFWIIALGIFTISFVYFNLVKKFILKWGKERVVASEFFFQHLLQGLASHKIIKLSGKENIFVNKFKDAQKKVASLSRNFNVLLAMPRIWLELTVIIIIYLIFIFSSINNYDYQKILITIAIFTAASFRVMPSLNRILNSLQSLQYVKFSIDYIFDELGKIKNFENINNINHNNKNFNEIFSNKISFIDINFIYKNNNKEIFNNLNLEIYKNTIVGIIGESGSGKTTLLNLLLGLLKPTKGSILIDRNSLEENILIWQKNIGYVPQSVYLLDDTLENNICFGLNENEIDISKLNNCIKKSQLENFINQLPHGLKTRVGERGAMLSGGQIQRIGLARALYHNPDILILDEATSSLDIDTENKIVESVLKLRDNLTIIIVSHRMNTISNADMIYEVKNFELKKVK